MGQVEIYEYIRQHEIRNSAIAGDSRFTDKIRKREPQDRVRCGILTHRFPHKYQQIKPECRRSMHLGESQQGTPSDCSFHETPDPESQ